jgi:2-amino-4-hydroxy-6-hydroxymethyldihydropteridine diphosphokinase
VQWLLLLGAEARHDTLDAALEALRALGEVEPLTRERLTEAANGAPQRYRNRLVRLHAPLEREALVEACKAIERAFGRGRVDGVPLDIDLLACSDGERWHIDAHAREKGEFQSPHVRLLLADAGLDGRLDAGA